EGDPQALVGVLDRRPALEVRRGVRRLPMCAARGEQRGLVGEVAIQRGTAHAGVLGYGAERSSRRAERPVQLHGALGDPPAGPLLELGAALLAIRTLLIGHSCSMKFATAG